MVHSTQTSLHTPAIRSVSTPQPAQVHVELGADEDAEAPLEDAHVAALGRQLVNDLEALCAFDAGRCGRLSGRGAGVLAGNPAAPPIPEEAPAVEPVRAVHLLAEHDRHLRTPGRGDHPADPRGALFLRR